MLGPPGLKQHSHVSSLPQLHTVDQGDGTIPKVGGLYGSPSTGHLGVCAIYSETTVTFYTPHLVGLPLLPRVRSATPPTEARWMSSHPDQIRPAASAPIQYLGLGLQRAATADAFKRRCMVELC